MDDTSMDISNRVREMFQRKTPLERLKMGASMYETSKYLVADSIYKNTPVYSAAELRKKIFLKFYGEDFDPIAKEEILTHLGASATPVFAVKNFDHIPVKERTEPWWKLLYPFIFERLLRENQTHSKLLKTLFNIESSSWKAVKRLIEIALKHVINGERILDRRGEMENSPDLDAIIDEMFAALRAITYLLIKGFENIQFLQKGSFKADFANRSINIETIYVYGPEFKTQEYVFLNPQQTISPIYKILPDKLLPLLEKHYLETKERACKDSLILMITDIEETHMSWLDHIKVQGNHPIHHLLLSWEIPTVLFGYGSVYEPNGDALGGIFGMLEAFHWQKLDHYFSTDAHPQCR